MSDNCSKAVRSNSENAVYPIPQSIKWKENNKEMHPEVGNISLAPKEKALLELQNLNSRHIFNLEQVRLQSFQVTMFNILSKTVILPPVTSVFRLPATEFITKIDAINLDSSPVR